MRRDDDVKRKKKEFLMKTSFHHKDTISRREFFKKSAGGLAFSMLSSFPHLLKANQSTLNDVFWVKNIPDQPFYGGGSGNYHLGLDTLLYLLGEKGLKFYRSSKETSLSGPSGLIAAEDIVLIKVNAQWKYRGATNSDLIRGLIQRILNHPDVFRGEVVIFENGQGRGSLNCDTNSSYSDAKVHANANDENHSFLYLVNNIFNDPRVSAYLLDSIRNKFIASNDHTTDGYRTYENVSYPCFTTSNGRRVELREGIWNGNGYSQNLKLINVPVLKYHDQGGSEITASLKHFYGIVSMSDGQSGFRHYSGLGETCGKMVVSVCTPVLNIIDAIWVSHSSLTGYPASTTFRANQILASQDPVALDYWAAKYVLYPIDQNFRHHPDYSGIDRWLTSACDIINSRGGLKDPERGIVVERVTRREEEIRTYSCDSKQYLKEAVITLSSAGLRFVGTTDIIKTQTQDFDIFNSGIGEFSWRIEKDADWLSCAPSSGVGDAKVRVTVNPVGLGPGKYTAKILIFSQEASNSPQSVTITFKLYESLRKRPRHFQS